MVEICLLLESVLECRTFTRNGVFAPSGLAAFTEVNDLNVV